jgi:hypothetical protein
MKCVRANIAAEAAALVHHDEKPPSKSKNKSRRSVKNEDSDREASGSEGYESKPAKRSRVKKEESDGRSSGSEGYKPKPTKRSRIKKEDTAEEDVEMKHIKPETKKLARPKKEPSVDETIEATGVKPAPKKRGRPKKEITAIESEVGDEPAKKVAKPRKKAGPSKVKVEEEVELATKKEPAGDAGETVATEEAPVKKRGRKSAAEKASSITSQSLSGASKAVKEDVDAEDAVSKTEDGTDQNTKETNGEAAKDEEVKQEASKGNDTLDNTTEPVKKRAGAARRKALTITESESSVSANTASKQPGRPAKGKRKR